MDYRTVIFYGALLLLAGSVAELYVRTKGMGEHVDKVRGIRAAIKPKLGPPVALLIVAIIVAAVTFPR
jgi:hypothetical protein